MGRVYRVKGKNVVKHYRVIPYDELAEILSDDGEAFFEDTREFPLKRGTVWRAARRLSEILGKPVRSCKAFLRFEDGTVIEGYSFWVEDEDTD